MSGSNDYEVGYCKPPKSGQFKPGISGNSKGRPKLIKDLNSDILEEMQEIITITEGNSTKKMTKQRALIKRITANALNGNIASIKLLTSMIKSLPNDNTVDNDVLTDEDAKILEDYVNRRIQNEKQ